MKHVLKMLTAVAGIAVMLSMGVLTVGAAADTNTNDSPEMAAYVDGQTHVAPMGKSLWYKFDYRTSTRPQNRTPIFLTLVNGNNSGVEFMVYTADQAIDQLPDNLEDWRGEIPTGQGTALRETCDSHIARPKGDCVSKDLTWAGTFANSGPYYVRIKNTTQSPQNFTLQVQGQDVSVSH